MKHAALFGLALAGLTPFAVHAQSQAGGSLENAGQGMALVAEEDPFLWLEAVDGERALDWVKAQNAETARRLEASPLFDELYLSLIHI